MVTNRSEKHKGERWYPTLLLLTLVLCLWAAIFYESIYSALTVWYTSEIFNHCFFVIPGSLYLIYRKKQELLDSYSSPNYWLLLPIVALLILYALGLAGSVQLFTHIAIFSLLPLFIWMLIGNKSAHTIAFPLLFILFAIPIGEELIPWLQQVTATISVFLLNLSSVPIFRTGLYIEIPGGRFLVAEACSGISFFIASIVIGTLYAHLNIRSAKKRFFFVLIAIIYPILANAVRVYGIILTAHLTDMEYAAGADHLIYGGVFFAIVIISLLFIGELFRDKYVVPAENTHISTSFIQDKGRFKTPMLVLTVLLGMFYLWFNTISARLVYQPEHGYSISLPAYAVPNGAYNEDLWKVFYKGFEQQDRGVVMGPLGSQIDYYLNFYVPGKGELINGINRLYKQDDWTIVKKGVTSVALSEGEQQIAFEVLSDPAGGKRLLASWFVLNGQIIADKRQAKLVQIVNTLTGRSSVAGIVALSQPLERTDPAAEATFLKEVGLMLKDFSGAIPH